MASGDANFWLVFSLAAVAISVVNGCGINIRNSCPYTLTTCAQNSNNLGIDQYNLGPGDQQLLDFGSECTWIGAIWPSVNRQCTVANDRNLANLAEFSIGGGIGRDFYDITNVNAYAVGMKIRVLNNSVGFFDCASPVCVINDIRRFCLGNNQLVRLPTGFLSCVNTDGINGQGPTEGTRIFSNACPKAYSYSFDDVSSLFTCGSGSNYEVEFCPPGD